MLWQNLRPSSTRYCRPLKLEFTKESTEIILSEQLNVQEQIKNLLPSIVSIPGSDPIQVHHRLIMSMIDRKVCNAVTYTKSSQRCCLCGALPREMNNINELLEREVNTDALHFGLSTLHAYICFFDWLLHVSCRLEIQAWKKSKGTKDLIEKRKKKYSGQVQD